MPIDAIDAVAARLCEATGVVVFTGAGVSAESGIPTFREALTGLWARFDPLRLATPEAFRQDPDLVWGWYAWRRAAVAAASPNPAHLAIAALAGRVPRLTLITQNVDDLHERAGSPDVLHLHGEIARAHCLDCARPYSLSPSETIHAAGEPLPPPRCPVCGGAIRPGVVWFGESLPVAAWGPAIDAVRGCDVFLSVGTSGLVSPASELPVLAKAAGAMLVQVNLEATEHDALVDHALVGPAGEVLPRLVAALEHARTSPQHP